MKYKSTDKVKILEYKFIFEEEIQTQKEYAEGSADLNYRLSFFRKKLDSQKGKPGQQELYDKMFMGHVHKDNKTNIITNKTDEQSLTQSAFKASSNEKPWVKKTHRQIVMATHPDKTSNIQSQHLKEQLTEQYRIAQKAYNEGLYSDLIMIAFDLNITVPDAVISEEITPASDSKKKKISNTKKTMGWQWFHVPINQKNAELKKILLHYGFKFTDDEVKQVIKRKYIKRKTGTRPEKMFVKRKRIK